MGRQFVFEFIGFRTKGTHYPECLDFILGADLGETLGCLLSGGSHTDIWWPEGSLWQKWLAAPLVLIPCPCWDDTTEPVVMITAPLESRGCVPSCSLTDNVSRSYVCLVHCLFPLPLARNREFRDPPKEIAWPQMKGAWVSELPHTGKPSTTQEDHYQTVT